LNLYKKQIIIISVIIVVTIFFVFSLTPPKNFESGITINIAKGETIKGAASELKNHRIIKSTSLFNFLITFYGHKVVEGDYYFENPVNLFQVLYKVTNGNYDIETKNITFFEGITISEMTDELVEVFPDFDGELFLKLAKQDEGFLFPDTYKFRINVTPEIVISTAKNNFDHKIEENKIKLEGSKYSLNQIIIMASIIEKESTKEARQEVANILWKRFEMDFPLQVDAPFLYSINKGTFDLTTNDLKSDSPYNTYKYLGLTPTPIGNPGIESILAAANPESTKNLYFLTGRDGKMYYADTFEGHKRNRLLYLD